MNFNPFAISGLLIVASYMPLFILLVIKGRDWAVFLYSLSLLCVGIWGVGSFLIATSQNPINALHCWKIFYPAVLFIPVFFFHSTFYIFNQKARILVLLAYSQAFLFTYFTLTDKLFISTRLMFGNLYFAQGNKIYILSFLFWLIIVGIAHLELIKAPLSDKDKRGQKIFYLQAMLGYLAGSTNFLPPLGISIYPYANFLLPICPFFLTYAILRHQALDITIVIRRSLVYSILIILISLIYLVIVFSAEKLLQGIVGYQSTMISLLSAFILGILFIPLKNQIQLFVDCKFFKGTPEQIAQQNELLIQELGRAEKSKIAATLASGIAHEIRNPITAIKTFSEYLPQKANDQEFLKNYSRTVNKEIDRIDNLIKDLLDFAKPSSPLLQETEIHDLLGNTLNLIQGKLQKNDIALQKDFHRSEIRLQIDPNQIKQALLNVLLNAIDAMPSGGKLTVKTSATENEAEIAITDTGCGIAPNDLPHIFEPFYSKKEKGTGLGLAICHGIIQEHSGKIIVESTLKKGTVCTVRLPIKT